MKKIFVFLLIGCGLMVATSCTIQYNTVQPNQTLLADLTPSDWTTADTGKNFTAFIKTPQINNFVNSEDGVLIYFTFDNGNSYEQIPEVYNNVSFTYTYANGGINLYAQSANGAQVITAPQAFTAKIVLVDSN